MHRWQFHAQWQQHARRSSMLGGAAFSGAHSMPRESSMPGEAAFSGGNSIPRRSSMPGEAACSGGQHKRAIHSSSSISCQGSLYNSFTVCCSPGNAAPPAHKLCCPLGITAPPVHAAPFWACCCLRGFLLPLWNASNKANLLRGRFILLIIF
jgi:hypothetical protein